MCLETCRQAQKNIIVVHFVNLSELPFWEILCSLMNPFWSMVLSFENQRAMSSFHNVECTEVHQRNHSSRNATGAIMHALIKEIWGNIYGNVRWRKFDLNHKLLYPYHDPDKSEPKFIEMATLKIWCLCGCFGEKTIYFFICNKNPILLQNEKMIKCISNSTLLDWKTENQICVQSWIGIF